MFSIKRDFFNHPTLPNSNFQSLSIFFYKNPQVPSYSYRMEHAERAFLFPISYRKYIPTHSGIKYYKKTFRHSQKSEPLFFHFKSLLQLSILPPLLMIRFSIHNPICPIYLFQQYHPHQLMRKRHFRKTERKICVA